MSNLSDTHPEISSSGSNSRGANFLGYNIDFLGIGADRET